MALAGVPPEAFERPEGRTGAAAAALLARENGDVERWAARQLPVGRVLEVACGPGLGLQALPPGAVGLDVSRPMVQAAHARAPGAAVLADAAAMPFKDGAFDAAMVVHGLDLLPAGSARELRRVLRDNAPVLVLHRVPDEGGPPPQRLVRRLEQAAFLDCRWHEGEGRVVVWGRAG